MTFAPVSNLLDEITNFLAAAPSAAEIIAFKPSEIADQRLHDLLDQNSLDELNDEGSAELSEFLLMNHFLKMLTLKARLSYLTLKLI